MAELSPTPTTSHGPLCNGVCKYDCSFDEAVHDALLTSRSPGSGDVEAPSGWFDTIDLDPDVYPADADLVGHYPGRFLVIRENNQGLVRVVSFATKELQGTAYEMLENQYEEWADSDGDQL